MGEREIHKPLQNYQEIADAVKIINERVNGTGFSFLEDSACRCKSFASEYVGKQDNAIVILASFDFSYYHDLEMIFYNVLVSNIGEEYYWWDHWTKDQIELSKEIIKDETGKSFFEFRFNIGTNKEDQYIVRAEKFSYHFGHVSYWNT